MKDSNLFVAELTVGQCKISKPINTQIGLTFRIGRTVSQSQPSKTIQDNSINFNITMQLNTDRLALDTHRCSLTLTYQNGSQTAIAGIALVNIPKELEVPFKKYKLMQSIDKKAVIQLSLKIRCLEENSSVSRGSSSSFRSILEMKDFQKKVISPPQLFEGSDLSEPSVHCENYLLPPRPKASRQREKNPLTISIHSQAIEEDRCQILQNECDCLKKLLKLQISKNKECAALIDKLAQALQNCQSTCCPQQSSLDETLLIQQSETKKQASSESFEMELLKRVQQLSIENSELKDQKRELQELLIKISQLTESLRIQGQKDTSKVRRMKSVDKYENDSYSKFERLTTQINHLEKQLLAKQEQLGQFKKKMKLESKFSSLKHINVQKAQSPTATIKSLMEREINEKKTMIGLLMKLSKKQTEQSKDVLFVKLKQKIEKAFNSMISKKLNKDILIYERGELLKHIQQEMKK